MNKRKRTSLETAVVDMWQREVGELSTRNFALRLRASEDLVLKLDLHSRLVKHRGCVNTVSFNADGDILVSGSDDRRVIFWDWETGRIKLSFDSDHSSNVFQAKIMPYTDDHSIVTCAADGQVRHAQILEHGGVKTKLLAKHQGRAHKLAIEPGSPHIFYTCGEDGLVQHIDLRTSQPRELFSCPPVDDSRSYMPVIHLNAISIDPRNPNLFAVAGSDEYARLFDIRKYKGDGSTDFGHPADYFCPPNLIGDDQVGITGLAFSDHSELLVSYNDENIYLFNRNMGLGPDPTPSVLSASSDVSVSVETDEKLIPQVYKGHRNCETVKGVSFFGPKSEYVTSGSDCGRIFIWRKKGGELIRVMEADRHVVNCIESHPHTTVLASSGIENDIKMWTPKAVERAVLPPNIPQVRRPYQFCLFSFIGDDEDRYYFDDEEDEDDDDGEDSGDHVLCGDDGDDAYSEMEYGDDDDDDADDDEDDDTDGGDEGDDYDSESEDIENTDGEIDDDYDDSNMDDSSFDVRNISGGYDDANSDDCNFELSMSSSNQSPGAGCAE